MWRSPMLDLASPLDGLESPFGASRGFNPLSLFAAGEVGAFFDPSDFSTMFQDNAGATPVTAVDQSVGLIRDKSGRGNHASQSNASFKPILKQDGNGKYYLLFDGTDDFLATSAIDFSGVNKVSMFAGVRKLNNGSVGIVAELSASSTSNAGTFALFAPNAANTYGFRARGSLNTILSTPASYTSPITNVLGCTGDIPGDATIIRINGSVAASDTSTDNGTGNFTNNILYIGSRAGSSLRLNGGLYPLIVRGAMSSAAEIASAQNYVNGKTGAY